MQLQNTFCGPRCMKPWLINGLISTASHGGEMKRTGNRSGASALLRFWWRWWWEAWIVSVSAEACPALNIQCLQSSVSEETERAVLKHQLSREHSIAWGLLFTTSSLGRSLPMAEWESTSKLLLLLLSTPWTWGDITVLCSVSLHCEYLDSSRFFITNLLPTPGFHCQNIYWLFKVVSIVRTYTVEFFVKNFLYNSYCCL